MNTAEKSFQVGVTAVEVDSARGCFDGKAHLDIGGGECFTDKPGMLREKQFNKPPKSSKLRVESSL